MENRFRDVVKKVSYFTPRNSKKVKNTCDLAYTQIIVL